MSAAASRLAALLESSVLTGFTAQAEAHGAEVARKKLGRINDATVAVMLQTFAKQRRDFAARAKVAFESGDMPRGRELGEAAIRADDNAKRIRDALGI